MREKNIAYLPIDTRPPNYEFVNQLAGILGAKVKIPEKEILGGLKIQSDCITVENWLLNVNAEEFIVSVDMLVYGGLIYSRENNISMEKSLNRLRILESLKENNPGKNIRCFNVIRRISSTVRKESDLAEYRNLLEYFKNVSVNNREKAIKVLKEINPEYIAEYYSLRERNHEINKKCVDYLSRGIIDELVLVQEDCFPNGPQQREREFLSEYTNKLSKKSIFIHNGTDEAGQELLLRTVMEGNTDISLMYDDAETINKIYRYEDMKFSENLNSHAALLNTEITDDADSILYVSGKDERKTAEDLKQIIAMGKRVVLLDLNILNGGSVSLIRKLEENNLIDKLYGYSAWNTVCNALGTALAELKLLNSDFSDREKLKTFFVERLIDDGFYQGEYRQKLRKLLEKLGIDSNYSEFMEYEEVRKSVEVFEEEMNSFVHRNFPELSHKKVKLEFPWKRLFECELHWI